MSIELSACVIAVAYHLNLVDTFPATLTPWAPQQITEIVSTSIQSLIVFIGGTRNFGALS